MKINWRQLQSNIDWMTIIFAALALSTGILLYIKSGHNSVFTSLVSSFYLLLKISPVIVAAMLVGGYGQALVPHEFVKKWLGNKSGFKGQLIASVAGALIPGGPFAAFPIVLVLQRSGASYGICINFLTAWSLIGINRILIWELAFFEADFIFLRMLVSLPLAIFAGYYAHWLFGSAQSDDSIDSQEAVKANEKEQQC
ncbi:MAG: permease [Pseudomonadales bacterium]|nr:permease [Pseudomonadales bacterium]